MKLLTLTLVSLWITVAAACAAATPTPLPTNTPPPTNTPEPTDTPEPLIAYPDIGFSVAELIRWRTVLRDIGLEQHSEVIRIYTPISGGSGNIKVIVSSKEHIRPVMDLIERAGIPFNRVQVLSDSPWHRKPYTDTLDTLAPTKYRNNTTHTPSTTAPKPP